VKVRKKTRKEKVKTVVERKVTTGKVRNVVARRPGTNVTIRPMTTM